MTSWRALEAPPPASTPKTYNPHYEDEDYHQHRDKWVPYSWIEPKKHYVRSYEEDNCYYSPEDDKSFSFQCNHSSISTHSLSVDIACIRFLVGWGKVLSSSF